MKVDPFIVPIPEKYLNSRDPQERDFYRYLVRFLHDLWRRTGGGDDAIELITNTTITGNDTGASALSEIFNRIEQQQLVANNVPRFAEYNPVTATRDYTAAPYDFVNAKNNARITLPSYGSVIVRNGDGSRIELWADGRDINDKKFIEIRRQGTALFLQYFIDDDEWFIR